MTDVGQYGVYVFGGQSSKQSSQVYALDPETYVWRRVNTLGVCPLSLLSQWHETLPLEIQCGDSRLCPPLYSC